MTESGIIPRREDRAQCQTCLDEGFIDVTDCTCYTVPALGSHEPMCGTVPCPEGCGDG